MALCGVVDGWLTAEGAMPIDGGDWSEQAFLQHNWKVGSPRTGTFSPPAGPQPSAYDYLDPSTSLAHTLYVNM